MTRRQAYVRIMVGVLLVAAVVAVAFARRAPPKQDAAAVPTPPKASTQEEMQERLQAQADEAGFRLRVNAAPQFSAGDAAGSLNLANSIENRQDMYVVITLDATGETIYRSAKLPPGGQVLEDKLLVPLAQGSHPATALAHVLDAETGEEAGTIETALTITVKS